MSIRRYRTLVIAALAPLAFLAPAAAHAASCQYHLNLENEAGKTIQVQKVRWKKKVAGDWKPWRMIEPGPLTLEDKKNEELVKKDTNLLCYRFQWKLQWKCAGSSTWNDYKIPADDPDNDRVSNWFLQFDGCQSKQVKRSEDGDFF